MSSRLRAIAHHTMSILDRGSYVNPAGTLVRVAADVTDAVAGTRLYLPDDPLPNATPAASTLIRVTRETTLEAARRLGGGVAALNFASAKNPGGGFLTGAQAQEEALARASALAACLNAAPEFYAFHRGQRDLLYSDRVIYSPSVPVFRDDEGALLEEPYRLSFLTCAAPNAGAIGRSQPGSVDAIPDVVRARAERVLRVAAAHGERRVVLGAWGCGVFRNDPRLVAAAFAAALKRCPAFEEVTFAILDTRPGAPTYDAFARQFEGADAD